jgi:hypothetical protein
MVVTLPEFAHDSVLNDDPDLTIKDEKSIKLNYRLYDGNDIISCREKMEDGLGRTEDRGWRRWRIERMERNGRWKKKLEDGKTNGTVEDGMS